MLLAPLVLFVLAGCGTLPQEPARATRPPASAAPTPEQLAVRLADKHAQPFLRRGDWCTDLATAQQRAAATGKLILVHCTRSFAPCGTSIRCEREVLDTPEFEALAGEVVPLCHVTTHLDAAADRLLAEWRGSGWPHHVVLDATGRVLGTHASHREKSVAELRDLVGRARTFLAEEAAIAAERQALDRRHLAAGLDTGALSLAEARALFARSGAWPGTEAATRAAQITDLEIADVLARFDRFDATAPAVVGGEFVVMYRHGKRPHERNATRDFWGGILLHVEASPKPNLELHREALAAFTAAFGAERGYQDFLAERRQAGESLGRKDAAATGTR